MIALPVPYSWLVREPGPKMLLEALKTYGTVEVPGAGSNPTILGWAKEVGLERSYTADSIPWCGLWMALIARRAGKWTSASSAPRRPLWALSWATWGDDGGQPELGDVLVFQRPGGGHVGLYVGEDTRCYHVLGGNQRDAVSIARVDKARLRACRAYFPVSRPPNIRPIVLDDDGAISENEA